MSDLEKIINEELVDKGTEVFVYDLFNKRVEADLLCWNDV